MSRKNALHAHFTSVLPRIVRHARCYFRWIKCYHTREDKIQEVRGLSWRWVQELDQDGKEWWRYVSRLADFACRAVKSGRKVAGKIKAKDVMNEITQNKRGFYVGKLPEISTESTNPLAEALTDNTQTPVDEQVAFRLDFPEWLGTRTDRDRRIIDDMMLNTRTLDLSDKHKLSQGRISQLRREFQQDWQQFCALPDER